MKSVCIIGAGISGMTVAHELVEKGWDVAVYEQDTMVGGMARSIFTTIPTEHSWRAYGPFYFNTFDIMKRIPLYDTTNSLSLSELKKHNKPDDAWVYKNQEVYDITPFIKNHPGGSLILRALETQDLNQAWDNNYVSWHLTNSNVQKVLTEHKIGMLSSSVYNNLQDIISFQVDAHITPRGYTKIISWLSTFMSSNKRNSTYFQKPMLPLFNTLDKNSYNYLVVFLTGAGYGFDINTCSIGSYLTFLQWAYQSGTDWRIMNQPTSDGWFVPWKRYLEKKGVKFFFGQSLTKINHENNNITSLSLNTNEVKADDYVIAINPNNLPPIFENSNLPELAKQHTNLQTVNNQIAFQIAFSSVIDAPKKGIILLDSPYNITLYALDKFFKTNEPSIWSGTCTHPMNKGTLYNKPATELSLQQLKQEIIHQLQTLPYFDKTKIKIIEIFSDWQEKDGKITSKNKKWVNTYFNQLYRPSQKTSLTNLFLSGAHTLTTVDVWTMESATEAGKLTTNAILSKYNQPSAWLHTHRKNWTWRQLATIDDTLYDFGLPHLFKITTLLLMLLLLVIIFIKIRK